MFSRVFARSLPALAATSALCCATKIAMCEDSVESIKRARVTAVKEVATTRFLRLDTLSYEDATGRARKWDMATRTTRKPGADVDGVAIIALLRRRKAPEAVEMLLVQQFRPPMNAVTVELPAGLIDPGESAEVAALRELKEETGYVGHAAYTSEKLTMSPGLCDECVKLCVVEVDLDAPENERPQQQLDDTEFIKVSRVPVQELLPTLKAMERDGCVPITALFTLAVGLSMASGVSGVSTKPLLDCM